MNDDEPRMPWLTDQENEQFVHVMRQLRDLRGRSPRVFAAIFLMFQLWIANRGEYVDLANVGEVRPRAPLGPDFHKRKPGIAA